MLILMNGKNKTLNNNRTFNQKMKNKIQIFYKIKILIKVFNDKIKQKIN